MDLKAFNVGDDIIYGLHGRGKVASIETMSINGKSEKFYKIQMDAKVNTKSSQVLIPVDRAREMGLRHPLANEDLPVFFTQLSSISDDIDLSRFNWEQEEKKIHAMLSDGKAGLAKAVGRLHQTLRAMPVISPTVENAYKQLRSQVQVEVTNVLKKHHKAVRNMINDALGGDYVKPYRKPVLPKFEDGSETSGD